MRVELFEMGRTGGQATGAAAGMLAPFAEAGSPGPFFRLGAESLRRWQGFASELSGITEIDCLPKGPGMLRVARSEQEWTALQMEFAWQSLEDDSLRIVSASELTSLEPELNPDILGGILSPREQHTDPAAAAQALRAACVLAGVQIHEGRCAQLSREAGKAAAVVDGTIYAAGAVLLAGGAWSGVLAEGCGLRVPVRPIRGQICSVEPGRMPIRHTVYTHSAYLVPKSDGRIVIGATEDDAGFDTTVVDASIHRLRSLADGLLGVLREIPLHSAWAGLRPASADGLPILGKAPGVKGLWIAAGHYRNGILLAPVTADLVADALEFGRDDGIPAAFRPDRFAA
jgi:glycine oxidase